MIEKLKNPIILSSIISTCFLILSAFGVLNIPNETVNTIINAILSTLAMLGVINSSTSSIKNSDFFVKKENGIENENENEYTDNSGLMG